MRSILFHLQFFASRNRLFSMFYRQNPSVFCANFLNKSSLDLFFSAIFVISALFQIEYLTYLRGLSFFVYGLGAFFDFYSFCLCCRKSLEKKRIKDYAALSLIS